LVVIPSYNPPIYCPVFGDNFNIKLTEIQEEIKRILKDLNMEDLRYENFIKKLI